MIGADSQLAVLTDLSDTTGFLTVANSMSQQCQFGATIAHCETITHAEKLPDIAFLREVLTRYEQGEFTDSDHEAAEAFSASLETYVALRKERFTIWISRFEGRSIPGRCIECGFSEFQFLTAFTDDETFPDAFSHPGCGGMMRMVGACHASPATFFVLDGDGNRMSV